MCGAPGAPRLTRADRGYPIEQLAEHSSFLETAYLIIYGELPTQAQFQFFSAEVLHHSALHTNVERLLGQFNDSAHPMAVLSSGFAALGAFAPEANPALQGQTLYTRVSSSPPDTHALSVMDKQLYRIIGKSISLAAASYRVRQGRPLNRPPHGLSCAWAAVGLTLDERLRGSSSLARGL